MSYVLGVELRPDERIDNLERGGLKLIQSPRSFSFSLDALLLAHFVSVANYDTVMDFCTGSGVVPLLLSTRAKGLRQVGLELNPEVAERAQRSIRLNKLEETIEIVEGDVRQVKAQFSNRRFSLVTVNPPYLPIGLGETSVCQTRRMARHEVTLNLAEVTSAAAYLIATGGKLAMVHRAFRLTDILIELRKNRLEPKRLRLVHQRIDSEASLVLVEAVKDAKPDLKIGAPFFVRDENGAYSPELQEIYAGGGMP